MKINKCGRRTLTDDYRVRACALGVQSRVSHISDRTSEKSVKSEQGDRKRNSKKTHSVIPLTSLQSYVGG